MQRTTLGDSRFRSRILSDAAMRDVSAADVADLLREHGGDVRDSEQFRTAEREQAYIAREEGE